MVVTGSSLAAEAARLARAAAVAVAGSPNEASLRHELEVELQRSCEALRITWTPFTLDLRLKLPGTTAHFADVAHGALVIEYEPPRSFGGREGSELQHARGQAADYAQRLHFEEGRPLDQYVLAAWDGAHICFGRFAPDGEVPEWQRLVPFNEHAAQQLLQHLRDDGVPLVHARLLAALVGPESAVGSELVPALYDAVLDATPTPGAVATKTHLLFREWRRLFGQVAGVQSEQLRSLVAEHASAHARAYPDNPEAYLFALNTAIGLVAKLVAALALPNASEDLRDARVPVRDRLRVLESGELFHAAGISNMLNGDFFSWYVDDASWEKIEGPVHRLLTTLSGIDFDVTKKSQESLLDLFKGIYSSFVPRAVRHARGEFYTPDWLADFALDRVGWQPDCDLMDPTCGSGTFLMQAVARRMRAAGGATASELLARLWGIDLNPLAVLMSRASLVVQLASRLPGQEQIRLPVYLADAINSAEFHNGFFTHTLQTELGQFRFSLPAMLINHDQFFTIFARLRSLLDDGFSGGRIMEALEAEFSLGWLADAERAALGATVDEIVRLHGNRWDGIWCTILAERFAAAAIPPSQILCFNPPWVKWSNLPTDYAELIKPELQRLGLFSSDRWVGGIESDISTLIVYEAARKWLRWKGRLAAFITESVFSTESSEGFRTFRLPADRALLVVGSVDDFELVSPFEGVTNRPTLMVATKQRADEFQVAPRQVVPYRVWHPPILDDAPIRVFRSAAEFTGAARFDDLLAAPVPGTPAGPWLRGTHDEHQLWQHVLGPEVPAYRARKGITTDANGIYFVEILRVSGELAEVANHPEVGRQAEIPATRGVVEREHLFALLRGRGVQAFKATPDRQLRLLLPQRRMHGDPDLPSSAPHAYRFLRRFREILEQRGSYRRYQARAGAPYWSVWTVGPYTFADHKVVWKEMSGRRFAAAAIGPTTDPELTTTVIVPDHKLYFVPCTSAPEAHYLAGVLNAPVVARAISSFAARLSLGTGVVDYLKVPRFDPGNSLHENIAKRAQDVALAGVLPSSESIREFDVQVRALFQVPDDV